MVPLKPNATQRPAFWDILMCIICVLCICQYGYTVARSATKLFPTPVEIHCGDYVRVKSGFYTGVEGWAKSKNVDIEITPNQDALPDCLGRAVPMSFAPRQLDVIVEPAEKDIRGRDAASAEIQRTLSEMSKAKFREWKETKPVTVDGAVFRVAIMNFGPATVEPQYDTPL